MRTSPTLALCLLALSACDASSGSKAASSGSPASPGLGAKSTGSAATSPPSATAPAEPPPPPSDVPTAAASANLTMNDATVDGLVLKTISCNAPGANPFAAIGLFAPLAKQKTVLDGCVDKPADVRVTLNVKDKKASDVHVADAPDAKVARCVAKAIESAEWGANMSCVATVSLKAPPKK